MVPKIPILHPHWGKGVVHAIKWLIQNRYIQVEAFDQIDKEEVDPIISITTKAA